MSSSTSLGSTVILALEWISMSNKQDLLDRLDLGFILRPSILICYTFRISETHNIKLAQEDWMMYLLKEPGAERESASDSKQIQRVDLATDGNLKLIHIRSQLTFPVLHTPSSLCSLLVSGGACYILSPFAPIFAPWVSPSKHTTI